MCELDNSERCQRCSGIPRSSHLDWMWKRWIRRSGRNYWVCFIGRDGNFWRKEVWQIVQRHPTVNQKDGVVPCWRPNGVHYCWIYNKQIIEVDFGFMTTHTFKLPKPFNPRIWSDYPHGPFRQDTQTLRHMASQSACKERGPNLIIGWLAKQTPWIYITAL